MVAYSKAQSWRFSHVCPILSFILQVWGQARKNKHVAAQLDSSGVSSVSAFVSSTAASHQYLQRPRAECSDNGSKVRPVYLLRCQPQPHLMLLLVRDRFSVAGGTDTAGSLQEITDRSDWCTSSARKKRQPQAVDSNSPLAFLCLRINCMHCFMACM